MTKKPDFRGSANMYYIPANGKRLKEKFGDGREVGPIRDEIERAYDAGCVAGYERGRSELEPLLAAANVAFEVYQALEHNAINADEAQTKLGDALERLIWSR